MATVVSLDPVATRVPWESMEKMPLRVGWRSSMVLKSLGNSQHQQPQQQRITHGLHVGLRKNLLKSLFFVFSSC